MFDKVIHFLNEEELDYEVHFLTEGYRRIEVTAKLSMQTLAVLSNFLVENEVSSSPDGDRITILTRPPSEEARLQAAIRGDTPPSKEA